MYKACGGNGPYFANGRDRKRYYRNRRIQRAKLLLKAVVRIWASVSMAPEDLAAVR